MDWTKRRRALVALLLLAAAAAAFVAKKWQGPAVDVAHAQSGPLRHSIVVAGRVQAPHRVEIGSVITGRVDRVLVEEGAVVASGQPLILLDTAELKASLEQARAAESSARARVATVRELNLPQAHDALAQAEAQYRFAEQEYRRNRELRVKGFVSEARLQDVERQRDVAKSQLDTARTQAKAQTESGVQAREAEIRVREATAARELAETRLAQATIRASVPGTVIVRAVEPGDIVSPSKRLLVLNSREETRLTAQIDEKNLPYLAAGQEALASSEAFPQERFKAALYYVSPGVDVTRGSVEARFRVPDPPAYLRADMTVSIDIGVARKERALTVPAEAVREANGVPMVQRVNGGRIENVKVRTGVRAGGRVEILSGLAEGDGVALASGLADGARVRARESQR